MHCKKNINANQISSDDEVNKRCDAPLWQPKQIHAIRKLFSIFAGEIMVAQIICRSHQWPERLHGRLLHTSIMLLHSLVPAHVFLHAAAAAAAGAPAAVAAAEASMHHD